MTTPDRPEKIRMSGSLPHPVRNDTYKCSGTNVVVNLAITVYFRKRRYQYESHKDNARALNLLDNEFGVILSPRP
mgnify:CR=1 FL=1